MGRKELNGSDLELVSPVRSSRAERWWDVVVLLVVGEVEKPEMMLLLVFVGGGGGGKVRFRSWA